MTYILSSTAQDRLTTFDYAPLPTGMAADPEERIPDRLLVRMARSEASAMDALRGGSRASRLPPAFAGKVAGRMSRARRGAGCASVRSPPRCPAGRVGRAGGRGHLPGP